MYIFIYVLLLSFWGVLFLGSVFVYRVWCSKCIFSFLGCVFVLGWYQGCFISLRNGVWNVLSPKIQIQDFFFLFALGKPSEMYFSR